jgi:DNA-binding NarL/FixJ family response regulator
VRAGVTNLLSRDRRLEVAGEAKNGREAVALARQLRPDIVVMDIRMPEMDGIEATRLIRAEWPDVIVIGVSAFGDEGFKAAMLGAGAAGLLDKADAGVKLRALIAECLAARRKGARTEP